MSGPVYDAPVTPYEGELLDNLIEEASEVIKAASKIKRFGRRPTDSTDGKTYDNVRDLSFELGNLLYVMRSIGDPALHLLLHEAVLDGQEDKERKMRSGYMRYKPGVLGG